MAPRATAEYVPPASRSSSLRAAAGAGLCVGRESSLTTCRRRRRASRWLARGASSMHRIAGPGAPFGPSPGRRTPPL
eukprot:9160860-Lingulodinium_polyedra.AAC.1